MVRQLTIERTYGSYEASPLIIYKIKRIDLEKKIHPMFTDKLLFADQAYKRPMKTTLS